MNIESFGSYYKIKLTDSDRILSYNDDSLMSVLLVNGIIDVKKIADVQEHFLNNKKIFQKKSHAVQIYFSHNYE